MTILDRKSSKINVLIALTGMIIAAALASIDNVGLPNTVALAMFILIISFLWFGMIIGADMQFDICKEHSKKTEKK
jgi:hypothetical protein